MSFYTGKDNSNNAILHITNGVTPQSSMKSGVLANSIFHSSLPYLEVEVHKMIRVDANTLEAPISFINSVGSKQPFFLTVDGVLQNFAMDLFMYRWHSSSNATTNWPTNTYKYIRKASTTEENYAYIIKNINNRNYVPFTPTANDIKIGGGEFKIKGKNLYDVIFLQNAVINSEDNAFYADNSNPDVTRRMQAINSKVIGSVEIKSDPSETYIARGGHKLFTSNNLAKSKYKEKTPAVIPGAYNITPQWFYGCGSNGTLISPKVRVGIQASGFSDGDMFLLDWVPQSTEIYDMGLYKFKQGYIGTPSYWSHSELRMGNDSCNGRVTCCYPMSGDCYGDIDCYSCYIEGADCVSIEEVECQDYPFTYYDVIAKWILEGEGSDVVLYHQATYTISSDNCMCGCSTWGSGIQFGYESRLSTIKFY